MFFLDFGSPQFWLLYICRNIITYLVLFVIMTILHVTRWNINNLNGRIKHSICLDWLKRHRIDVSFVQVSHLKHSYKHQLANWHYYTATAATFNSTSRSALVLLRHSLSFTVIESCASEGSWTAYIKTNIYGQKIVFLCLYIPNH